jgi:hypothetical protein
MKSSSLFLMIFIINGILWGQNIDSISIKKYFNPIEKKLHIQREKIIVLKSELDSITNELNKLTITLKTQRLIVTKQKIKLLTLHKMIKLQKNKIDSLVNVIALNKANIKTISKELDAKIQQAEASTNKKIIRLNNSLSKNQLYWLIGSLMLLLLAAIIYFLLRKKIATDKTDIENKLINTRKALEEETIKIDNKLIELMDSQLKLMKEERERQPKTNIEHDHSLALKVADEITRILMNMNVMDPNIKGYKQLRRHAESILNNLKAYGYEVPELLGKEYNEGMNMIASMEFDKNLDPGKQIIKRIIKPQVNYNGKMIQAAKVVVAYNE